MLGTFLIKIEHSHKYELEQYLRKYWCITDVVSFRLKWSYKATPVWNRKTCRFSLLHTSNFPQKLGLKKYTRTFEHQNISKQ